MQISIRHVSQAAFEAGRSRPRVSLLWRARVLVQTPPSELPRPGSLLQHKHRAAVRHHSPSSTTIVHRPTAVVHARFTTCSKPTTSGRWAACPQHAASWTPRVPRPSCTLPARTRGARSEFACLRPTGCGPAEGVVPARWPGGEWGLRREHAVPRVSLPGWGKFSATDGNTTTLGMMHQQLLASRSRTARSHIPQCEPFLVRRRALTQRVGTSTRQLRGGLDTQDERPQPLTAAGTRNRTTSSFSIQCGHGTGPTSASAATPSHKFPGSRAAIKGSGRHEVLRRRPRRVAAAMCRSPTPRGAVPDHCERYFKLGPILWPHRHYSAAFTPTLTSGIRVRQRRCDAVDSAPSSTLAVFVHLRHQTLDDATCTASRPAAIRCRPARCPQLNGAVGHTLASPATNSSPWAAEDCRRPARNIICFAVDGVDRRLQRPVYISLKITGPWHQRRRRDDPRFMGPTPSFNFIRQGLARACLFPNTIPGHQWQWTMGVCQMPSSRSRGSSGRRPGRRTTRTGVIGCAPRVGRQDLSKDFCAMMSGAGILSCRLHQRTKSTASKARAEGLSLQSLLAPVGRRTSARARTSSWPGTDGSAWRRGPRDRLTFATCKPHHGVDDDLAHQVPPAKVATS